MIVIINIYSDALQIIYCHLFHLQDFRVVAVFVDVQIESAIVPITRVKAAVIIQHLVSIPTEKGFCCRSRRSRGSGRDGRRAGGVRVRSRVRDAGVDRRRRKDGGHVTTARWGTVLGISVWRLQRRGTVGRC